MDSGRKRRKRWTNEESRREWRSEPRVFWWIAFVVLGVGSLAFVVGVGIRDAIHRPGGVTYPFFIWLAIAGVFCLAIYRWTLCPRFIASASGVTVRNPFSTHALSWDEIAQVRVERDSSVRIRTTEDVTITVRALSLIHI